MASRFLITGGGSVTWTAVNTAIWSASSGGATGASVPVDGDTVTMDASSGGGTVTLGYSPTVTSITMGAFTGTFDASTFSPTMDTFSGTGTGVRTLTMGSGTWTLRGNNATIWTIATATNLTFSAGTSTVNCSYSGATGTRTLIGGSLTYNNFSFTAGSDIVSFNSSTFIIANLNFSGFTGTWSGNIISLTGNLTLGTGMTASTSTNTLSFVGTSGTEVLRSNGVQFNRPITIAATTGVTIQLFDALDMGGASSRTLTLTTGNFNANNFNVTCGAFSSSNSNTRVLTMGSGTWTLTGNAATIWNVGTTTGLTFNKGSQAILFTYSGATGTRAIGQGSLAAVGTLSAHPDFSITAGTDHVGMTNSRVGHFVFTGFGGTLDSGTRVVYGNLTLSATMTWASGTSITTFSSDAFAQVFTTAAIVTDSPFTIACTSTGSVTLNGALNNSTTNREILLSTGAFSTGNFNVTTGDFSSNNSSNRSITLGSSTITLTGTGTVWNTSGITGLTFNAGTSTIKLNDASASSKTFAPGVLTYYNLQLTGAGSGTFIIGTTTGATTFNNITVDTPPHTVQVFAGKTLNVTSLTWSGTAANPNIFQSTTNGTSWFLVSPIHSIQDENYISLQDSRASGGLYYAGRYSTNVSNNLGWLFQNFAGDPSTKKDDNGYPVWFGISCVDGITPTAIKWNPSNGGMLIDTTTVISVVPSSTFKHKNENGYPPVMGVSSSDSSVVLPFYVVPTTGAVLATLV